MLFAKHQAFLSKKKKKIVDLAFVSCLELPLQFCKQILSMVLCL